MVKKYRVRSKGLLGEGHLEKVLEVVDRPYLRVGDPIITMFSETGENHVLCTIVEILDEVPATT